MLNSSRKTLPKRVSEMSKGDLEEALKRKKECNKKALEIVELMLESPVNEDWFEDNLKYIRQTHFDDIVDERAILRICGYPLCSGKLKTLPTHQYHISTKLNKVFDTTERKKFCSNQCYKAAQYLKDQLLSSPLWFSGYEDIPNFKLLPINSIGMIGEEVDLGRGPRVNLAESSNKEFAFTSVNEFASESLKEISLETGEKADSKTSKHTVNVDIHTSELGTAEGTREELSISTKLSIALNNSIVDVRLQDSDLTCTSTKIDSETFDKQQIKTSVSHDNTPLISGVSIHNVNTRTETNIIAKNAEHFTPEDKSAKAENISAYHKLASTSKRDKMTSINNTHDGKIKPKVHQADIPGSMSIVLHVETCLREWFNLETMIFLFGEMTIKEMILDKGKSIQEYYKVISNASWDPKLYERYDSICKRLNLMEFEDNHYDQTVTVVARELKPLPDYTDIQEESRKLEMKISAFYQGKVTYVEDSSSVENTAKDDELTPDPMLPLVDSHAQKCYRRRIVQDRLSKVLPDLLRTFGLASRDISHEFRALVRTFSLEAHNIFFKPAEWNLLGLIIINMLAVKNVQLKTLLETEQAKNYQTLMLISYQQDSRYIDKLMSWLTNIDNLVDVPKQGNEDIAVGAVQ